MGKDRTAKGVQQTSMDQFTELNTGGGLQPEPSEPSGGAGEPSGTQILVAIEAYGQAVQEQISAMAVDINLLRTDLRAVVEKSVAAEHYADAPGCPDGHCGHP
ncbi:hypothetical protein NDU88_003708 [Pleurodeles waltl]|uniref:Uncharacterized protein n=1 Tax=Pleurodeles waltl TaxID=8319 RepID=A0AAV7VGJ8_PLEWA|nr:hypothetical protein NDU88_003708 [Pleurodeles waltl]